MPLLSANLSFLFSELPFEARFGAAARAGFSVMECMFPYELEAPRLRALLTGNQLRMDLFNLPAGDFAGGERGVAALPNRVDEFREGVLQAAALAHMMGTSKVNCLVGRRDQAYSWESQFSCLLENLTWATKQLAGTGLVLHIEPLCPAEVPDFFLNSTELADRILDKVDSPHLRLQFDVYHVQRGQGDVVSLLRRHADRIGHIQVADSPLRGAPGSGELNFNFIFEEIDRLGYLGAVGLEYRPTAPTNESLGWLIANGWHELAVID